MFDVAHFDFRPTDRALGNADTNTDAPPSDAKGQSLSSQHATAWYLDGSSGSGDAKFTNRPLIHQRHPYD